jgi:hypothetical protein
VQESQRGAKISFFWLLSRAGHVLIDKYRVPIGVKQHQKRGAIRGLIAATTE